MPSSNKSTCQHLSMSNPIHDVDSHWARRLQCDPATLHEPGLHVIRGSGLDRPIFMRYVVPFFALLPSHTPGNVVITSTESVCDEIAGWSLSDGDLSAEVLGSRLLEFAQGMDLEESYAFDILVASPDELHSTRVVTCVRSIAILLKRSIGTARVFRPRSTAESS
jgi:hypothetical protein